jgi:hypothetical protein
MTIKTGINYRWNGDKFRKGFLIDKKGIKALYLEFFKVNKGVSL